ncbi:MAG: hypothetical protein ACR2O1_05555 [Boseongicola sp.]
MAQPLSTADNTIEIPSLKHAASNSAFSGISIRRFCQRLGKLFWAYTEASGKADTSSYNGLL